MKVTFEIECENVDEIEAKLKALKGMKTSQFRCQNRLMLLKDIKDSARDWVDQARYPSLQEVKDLVWRHVFE